MGVFLTFGYETVFYHLLFYLSILLQHEPFRAFLDGAFELLTHTCLLFSSFLSFLRLIRRTIGSSAAITKKSATTTTTHP